MTAAENGTLHSKVPKTGSMVIADVAQLQHVIKTLAQAINDSEVNQIRVSEKFEKKMKAMDGKFDWLSSEVRKLDSDLRTGGVGMPVSPRGPKSRGEKTIMVSSKDHRGSIASSMPSQISAADEYRADDGARRTSSLNPFLKPATISHVGAISDHLNDTVKQLAELKQANLERFGQLEKHAASIDKRLREHESHVEQRFEAIEKQTAELIQSRVEKWGKGIFAELSAFQDKTNHGFADTADRIKDIEGRLQLLGTTMLDNKSTTQRQIERLGKLHKDIAEDLRESRSLARKDARQTRDDTRNAVAAAVREARHISSKMEQLSSVVPVDLSAAGTTSCGLFQPPEARRSGQLRMSIIAPGTSSESSQQLTKRPSSAGTQRLQARPSTPIRPQSATSALQSSNRRSASGLDDGGEFHLAGTGSRAHSPVGPLGSDLSPTGSDQLIWSAAAEM
eukprot:gnl/MRDRNA2_/MRDRNA2_117889_c0_seq1.p1 gnl/MRDRNA2_/MRDRNA2_117889_c0~~gnl/MRDRNA2_/MRDRNA2_117889_c0_seq1.p1  ORF type:complete len:450 (-),score=96.60 gnl/MRDRNA2_/MRDRNA2_117889_c0_seq1:9-1358(-)